MKSAPKVKDEVANDLPPTIFIQISDPQQRGLARQIQSKLEENKYLVPGIENVAKAPTNNELRYFHRIEEADARNAVELVRPLVGNIRPRYVKGYEDSTLIKPKQFEIWLANEPPPSNPPPSPREAKSDPSDSWLVLLGSFPKDSNGRLKAAERLNKLTAQGFNAFLIDTDSGEYPKLTPGFLVVAMGPYSQSEAKYEASIVARRGLIPPDKPYYKAGR